MSITIGKVLRRAEFWKEGQKSLLADISLTSVLGAMPGLETAAQAVNTLAPLVDGLIINPGVAEKQSTAFVGKLGAAALVRLDWSNAERPEDFVIPPAEVRRVSIAQPEDALQLGASAAVVSLLLGYDENFEAKNIQSISFTARACAQIALPLIVEVQLIGPKIDPAKFDGAVQLGVNFMVEGGCDALIIPQPGPDALAALVEYSPVPLFIKVDDVAQPRPLQDALRTGCAGICLSSRALAEPEVVVSQTRQLLEESSDE